MLINMNLDSKIVVICLVCLLLVVIFFGILGAFTLYEQSVAPLAGAEVFNIKENIYLYPEARDVCAKYGAKLASKRQMYEAYKSGANWCNLGWNRKLTAYYPTSTQQIEIANQWPQHLRNACGKEGINGGEYPPQLKLGVNCYGIKPPKTRSKHINPWNTVTGRWSKYD